MSDAISITLAGEPRGKGRPRFARATGRAFTPEATRSYEGALRYAAHQAMAGRSLLDGPLTARLRAVFSVPASMSKGKRELALAGILVPIKAPDADNILKTLDALNNVVFRDDKQVVQATISKFYGDQPALHIEIEPFTPTPIPMAAVRSGCAGDGEAGLPVSPDLETGSPRLPVGAGT